MPWARRQQKKSQDRERIHPHWGTDTVYHPSPIERQMTPSKLGMRQISMLHRVLLTWGGCMWMLSWKSWKGHLFPTHRLNTDWRPKTRHWSILEQQYKTGCTLPSPCQAIWIHNHNPCTVTAINKYHSNENELTATLRDNSTKRTPSAGTYQIIFPVIYCNCNTMSCNLSIGKPWNQYIKYVALLSPGIMLVDIPSQEVLFP